MTCNTDRSFQHSDRNLALEQPLQDVENRPDDLNVLVNRFLEGLPKRKTLYDHSLSAVEFDADQPAITLLVRLNLYRQFLAVAEDGEVHHGFGIPLQCLLQVFAG